MNSPNPDDKRQQYEYLKRIAFLDQLCATVMEDLEALGFNGIDNTISKLIANDDAEGPVRMLRYFAVFGMLKGMEELLQRLETPD
jgi:hypothetical protein